MCGINYEGTIFNCSAASNVTGGDNSHFLGGLCGRNYGIIFNCYATGDVQGENYLGGICGDNYYHENTISNCYATGDVIGRDNSNYLGGLCGENNKGTIFNCYATGIVTAGSGANYLGGLCGAISASGTISNCFWDVNTSGLDVSDGGVGLTTAEMQTLSTFTGVGWDFIGEIASGTSDLWVIETGQYPELKSLSDSYGPYVFAEGDGTESDPYKVGNAFDLGAVWQYPESAFILSNDINLAGIEWSCAVIPIPFTGKFDGNSLSVSNLSISGGDYVNDNLGLFALLDGRVMNLGLSNVNISGGYESLYVGGLCGKNNGGIISNCYITGNITGGEDSYYLGSCQPDSTIAYI